MQNAVSEVKLTCNELIVKYEKGAYIKKLSIDCNSLCYFASLQGCTEVCLKMRKKPEAL